MTIEGATCVVDRKSCPACGRPFESPIGIDWQSFGLDIRLAMAIANLSLRGVQAETGVDQATIHRVTKHAKPIRVEAYLALKKWAENVTTTPDKSGGDHDQTV